MDNVVFKVDVLPFQAKHFAAAVTTVYRKQQVDLILHRLTSQVLIQLLHLIYGVDLLFVLFLFRHIYSSARIVRQHSHAYSIAEYVTDKAQVMHCRFPRQRLTCVHILAVDKHICHELLNITSRYLVEPLVTYGRIDTLGELFHSCV